MTVAVFRVGTDTPRYAADDLSGRGAESTGGRYSRVGRPVVYASSSIALACIETLVHLNAGGLPLKRYLVRITIPREQWRARRVLRGRSLPVGWDAIPAGVVSLDLGEDWLAKQDALVLEVPSVIVPEESNVLLSPAHPHASRLKVKKLRRFTYDPRDGTRARR